MAESRTHFDIGKDTSGGDPSSQSWVQQSLLLDQCSAGQNRLLNAAFPMLSLAILLSSQPHGDGVGELLSRIRIKIREFEERLLSLGYGEATVMAARYAICTLLDECALSQDWGAESCWSAQSLLSSFHSETWGGEKFFVILERIKGEPHRFADLLELLYYCQAIGFEGRYHLQSDGATKLADLLKHSQNLLAQVKPCPYGMLFKIASPHEMPLSPNHKTPSGKGIGVLLGLTLVIAFMSFDAVLNARVSNLENEITVLIEKSGFGKSKDQNNVQ